MLLILLEVWRDFSLLRKLLTDATVAKMGHPAIRHNLVSVDKSDMGCAPISYRP
jgi:hypothetical protein